MNQNERKTVKNSKPSPVPFYIERIYAGRRNAEEVVADVMKAHCG